MFVRLHGRLSGSGSSASLMPHGICYLPPVSTPASPAIVPIARSGCERAGDHARQEWFAATRRRFYALFSNKRLESSGESTPLRRHPSIVGELTAFLQYTQRGVSACMHAHRAFHPVRSWGALWSMEAGPAAILPEWRPARTLMHKRRRAVTLNESMK